MQALRVTVRHHWSKDWLPACKLPSAVSEAVCNPVSSRIHNDGCLIPRARCPQQRKLLLGAVASGSTFMNGLMMSCQSKCPAWPASRMSNMRCRPIRRLGDASQTLCCQKRVKTESKHASMSLGWQVRAEWLNECIARTMRGVVARYCLGLISTQPVTCLSVLGIEPHPRPGSFGERVLGRVSRFLHIEMLASVCFHNTDRSNTATPAQ